ncbi:MAG: nucleotidyltransferase substrate binding protein, partial [Synergistetes bacterium]|nr:nucleotidyltransferase substrate binding protein [Synergistota bacterium]
LRLCFMIHYGVQKPCQNLFHSLLVILKKLVYNTLRKTVIFSHGLVSLLWFGWFLLFYRDTGPFPTFTAIILHYLEARNLTSHTYNEDVARRVYNTVKNTVHLFDKLLKKLKASAQ